MSETVICAVISAIAAITVAVVGVIATRINAASAQRDRNAEAREAKSEERAKLRNEQMLLALEMQDANTQLTTAIANALLGGHNNGNVERAYSAVRAAEEKYKAFTERIVARQVTK